MNLEKLSKGRFVLISILSLAPSVDAQTQTLTELTVTGGFKAASNTAGGGIEIRSNGSLIGKGITNPSFPNQGNFLEWNPIRGSLRAGQVANITQPNGLHSIALGRWATAGNYGVALGQGSIASADSMALMGGAASGQYSIAIGPGEARGIGAITLGTDSFASGAEALAWGRYSYAYASQAMALGVDVGAVGENSIAVGISNVSAGDVSLATGYNTLAAGRLSAAFGEYTSADAYNSVAMGRANVGGGNYSSWISTDPLFEIGNGDPNVVPVVRSNALTVFKNGNMDVQGAITCAPGGDIPMFGE